MIDSDVCVVGAGIVGLAHAFEARARGLSVTVVDRSARAVGASVRNFGHVIVSAMAEGAVLDCALDTRERWLSLGRRAGLELHQAGTLIAARADDELAVMEGIAADERRGARLLSAREVGRLAPIPTGELVGGLHAGLDLRVDPRRAVAALAALLDDDPQARVLFNAPVHEIDPGLVRFTGGEVRAPLIIVCPGPEYDWLEPELAPRREGLTRCKLQMLRVADAGRRALSPGAAHGAQPGPLSGLQRAARRRCPAREDRGRAARAASSAGVHLIVTQLPGGDLLLGDTHEYGETVVAVQRRAA